MGRFTRKDLKYLITLSKKHIMVVVIIVVALIGWLVIDSMLRNMEVNDFTRQRFGFELSMVKDNCFHKTKEMMLEVMRRDGVCVFSTFNVIEVPDLNTYRVIEPNVMIDKVYDSQTMSGGVPANFVDFSRNEFELIKMHEYSFIKYR